MNLESLDPILSTPKRLAALGMINASKEIEFSYIRDQLKLTDSDLSKQLKVLSEADYITSRRTGRGKKRKSWFKITLKGQMALIKYMSDLKALSNPEI